MGRPKRQSGGHAIRNAQALYAQSVESGEPDYTYVALAIGAAPHAPPRWAIAECIALRRQRELVPARGNLNDIPDILDDIVRYYDQKARDFEASAPDGYKGLGRYRAPSLRSAILDVLRATGQRSEDFNSANDDWFRDIREAWEWEQKHDLVPNSYIELEEGDLAEESGAEKRKLQTTSRIERVLMQRLAAENGDPEDTATWAWVTSEMIRDSNIKKAQPAPSNV